MSAVKSPKKALLVVSFGTTVEETRKKTLDLIEKDLSTAFPDRKLYIAWTSKMVLRILRKREDFPVDTVEEALDKLIRDEVTDLLVQPTNVINGYEYDKLRDNVRKVSSSFERVRIGQPLLSGARDNEHIVSILKKNFESLENDEALILIGHGTSHYAGDVYSALDYLLKHRGFPNSFVGSIEGFPDFDTILDDLQKTSYKKVLLVPFLIVAGVHTRDDIAGDDPNSWKNKLEAAGYQVRCNLKGLGEYPEFRQVLVEHAQTADQSDSSSFLLS